MAFNSRGEMNCWIFPALVASSVFSLSLLLSFLPQVSVQHPIVRDILPQCENQQMGNFVYTVSVGVCASICV